MIFILGQAPNTSRQHNYCLWISVLCKSVEGFGDDDSEGIKEVNKMFSFP